MSGVWMQIGMDVAVRTGLFTVGCAIMLGLVQRLHPQVGLHLRLWMLMGVAVLAVATVGAGILETVDSLPGMPQLLAEQVDVLHASTAPMAAEQPMIALAAWTISPKLAGAFLMVWGLGAVICVVHMVWQIGCLHRCRGRWTVLRNPQLKAIWRVTCDRHQWRRPTVLLVGGRGHSTFVMGWFRPAVVIPIELVERADDPMMPAILGHEIEHLKRGDLIWTPLVELLRGLFWWNPLVHSMAGQVRALTEVVCDLGAVRVYKNRHAYAGAVLAEAVRVSRCPQMMAALCHVPNPISLEQRIKHIMKGNMHPTKQNQIIHLAALLILATGASLLFGLQVTLAEEKPVDQSSLPLVEKEPEVTVSFANLKVGDALAYLATASNRTIHYAPAPDAEAPVITVNLQNVPISVAVRHVGRLAKLEVEERDEAFFVVAQPK